MPFLTRPVGDERDALLAFLAQQRDALRNSVAGLTEEQVRRRPSASSLSLAAVLKHIARTERRWIVVLVGQRDVPDLWPIREPEADFRVEDGETIANLLTDYANVAAETESIIGAVADLGERLPGAEGYPISAEWSTRWVLLHLIEETARHAGHADVIRESLDQKTAVELLNTIEAEQH